jgi:hypothetical protein
MSGAILPLVIHLHGEVFINHRGFNFTFTIYCVEQGDRGAYIVALAQLQGFPYANNTSDLITVYPVSCRMFSCHAASSVFSVPDALTSAQKNYVFDKPLFL